MFGDSYFWRKLLVRSGLARYSTVVRREIGDALDYLHHYSDRTLAIPTRQVLDPALLPSVQTPDSIDLALSAPVMDVSLSTGRGLNERRPTPFWGMMELRGALAAQVRSAHRAEFDPSTEVLITHGATGAFAAAIDAFVNPGDHIVLFDPTSPLFSIGLTHRRARLRWLKSWSDQGRLRFAMDEFTKAMRGAKMLVLADPANPTGCVLAPEDIEQIAFWARKHDVLVYQDASYDNWRSEPPRTRLASLPNAAGRVLTSGSFAKSHGLSALRVGWLVGDRHLLRPCAGAMFMSAPPVSSLCQHLALQALHALANEVLALRDAFAVRRDCVRERLVAMRLLPWQSTAGYFCWLPAPHQESGRDFAQRLLRETGVLVGPGEPFGPSASRFVRLSLATDEGRLREGLGRLETFLQTEPIRQLPVAQFAS